MGKVKLDFLYNYQLKLRLFFIIFFLVALDQISKFLIINNLETNQSENIFNLLSFTFVKNYGVAFSFLNNESFNMSGWIALLVFLICIILFLYIKILVIGLTISENNLSSNLFLFNNSWLILLQ